MSDTRESVDISDLKETFLECTVCRDTFDQTDKRPRLLHSCLHAFCTECLERLLVKEGKNQITCPLCRRVEKIKTVKSLPVDPVRNKLVDYLLLRNKKQVLCTEGEDNNPAIGRCQECQSYLCKDCDYVHRRHKHSKHHKIISLEKVLEEPIRCLSAKHCCPSHPDHHLEFYCTADGKLCCLSCTVLEHKGHDLVGLEEAEVEQRTEMDVLLKDVLKKASAMRKTKQKNIHQQKQMKDTKEKSMKDIDAMFDTLKLYLDQRKRVLINSIESKSDKFMTAMQKNTDALDETLAFIESTVTYYTEAKEKADTAEMLQLYPTIKRSLEGIDEPESLNKTVEALSSLTFERIGEDEARKAIAKLGDKPDENLESPLPDKSLSVGCLDVYIYKANMTTLQLDAIVNTANGHLGHGGGLARVIAAAAGRDLEDEGKRYIRDNGDIPVTGVVRTTAGNLPCKMVLHAVGPYWPDYRDYEKVQCSVDLCMTVLRCLIEADKNGARDVSIPPISSGIFKVPYDICCAAYVRGVRLFGELCRPRTLKRAHFVDINDGMLTKIQDEFVRCKGKPLHGTEQEKGFINRYMDQGAVPKQSKNAANFDHPLDAYFDDSTGANNSTKPYVGPYSYRVKGTNTTVKLYCGDLTKVRADGVVSWENTQMEPATEDSIRLREAAGQPERMYTKNLFEVFSTTPGRLNKVKRILHVIVPVSTMSLSDLGQVHERIFGTAEVSAPVLALSLLELRKVQLEDSAAGFCKSLTEHVTAQNGGIKEVHVIDNRPGHIAKIKKIFDIIFQIEGLEFDGFDVVLAPDKCSLCHDVIIDEKTLNKCGHTFCRGCIDEWFKEKPVCPNCGVIYGVIPGTMPPGIMSVKEDRWSSLPGLYGVKYTITYNIKGGYQTAEHPNPGSRYKGAYWTAYLPNNKAGETVLRLLKVAFKRRLTFTVGRSTSTGAEDKVTWNDIHHKTSSVRGAVFGYPDAGYLQRVTEELAAKGVTEADIDLSVPVTQSVVVT